MRCQVVRTPDGATMFLCGRSTGKAPSVPVPVPVPLVALLTLACGHHREYPLPVNGRVPYPHQLVGMVSSCPTCQTSHAITDATPWLSPRQLDHHRQGLRDQERRDLRSPSGSAPPPASDGTSPTFAEP